MMRQPSIYRRTSPPRLKAALPRFRTIADLIDRLGGIPAHRIRLQPPPGTAKEKDLFAALESPRKYICELIDGVLVEKPMGATESIIAGEVLSRMNSFAGRRDLGIVLGADGTLELLPGLIRIADVSFISWDRIPGGVFPKEPIPALAANLAVEVISESNTKKEMERKIREFFETGTEMVWLIYPKTQTAEIYTSPTKVRRIPKDGVLDGGKVLPGFKLPLKQVFARLRRRK